MDYSTNAPPLTILLVCYNQEKYIRRALEGVVEQHLPDDKAEIVVADDCSNDGTLEIIKSVLNDNPRFDIRILESQGNVGITRNYQRGFQACRGKYVAVLEGDDYWTDSGKVRQQIAFLEKDRVYNACATNFYIYDEDRATFELRFPSGPGHTKVDARRLALENFPGNFSSFVYRRDALASLRDELFSLRAYDWLVNICVAKTGPIGVLHEPMSVYRMHGGGAWTRLSELEKIAQQIEDIRVYDEFTERVFHDEFETTIEALRSLYLRATDPGAYKRLRIRKLLQTRSPRSVLRAVLRRLI